MIKYNPNKVDGEVKALQRLVNTRYSYYPALIEDGIYGDKSAEAFREVGWTIDFDGKEVNKTLVVTSPILCNNDKLVSWVLLGFLARMPYKYGGQLTNGDYGSDCSGIIVDAVRLGHLKDQPGKLQASKTYDACVAAMKLSKEKVLLPGMIVTYDNDVHAMVCIAGGSDGIVCGYVRGRPSTTTKEEADRIKARVELRVVDYRKINRFGWLVG